VSAHRCRDCGKTVGMDVGAVGASFGARVQGRYVTREWILASIREWVGLHHRPPNAADWNLAMARRTGQQWRVNRTLATRRPWPSVTSVRNHFGSWNAAITAAGYTPQRSRRAAA